MSLQQTAGLPAIVALHRYSMHANRMRQHFEAALKQNPSKPRQLSPKPNITEIAAVMTDAVRYSADDRGMFMSYWYGTLYVVIEGWKQLRLSDPRLDKLIKSPNVGRLKLYRNGVYHFQRNYFDDRFAGFMKSKDSVAWVREVHSEFGRFFLEAYARRQAEK